MFFLKTHVSRCFGISVLSTRDLFESLGACIIDESMQESQEVSSTTGGLSSKIGWNVENHRFLLSAVFFAQGYFVHPSRRKT